MSNSTFIMVREVMMKRFSVADFAKKKSNGEKITMITAYDKLSANIADSANVDAVLVGDSLGMVVLGYDDTLSVTMEDMICHAAAVRRSNNHSMIVCDMPFMSYQVSTEKAVENACRLVQETGCTAVKLEGGVEYAEVIRAIVRAGIPVVAHIGYTPQSINVFGGHKSQGRDEQTAEKVVNDALAVQEAGAFAVTLECVPYEIAKIISQSLYIPTIGIGSGADCDGQVLVFHDLLGLCGDFLPKHVKRFVDAQEVLVKAVEQYVQEVSSGVFPTENNSFVSSEQAINVAKKVVESKR